MINKLSTKFQVWFASFLIWLFHISAMIGITMGHKDWFLEKTPLNLSLSLVLFFWIFPINTMKRALLFVLFFGMGMLAEWLGVTYSLLFGEYEYGEALGPKLDWCSLVDWLLLGATCIYYL
jgi:putative membrane protein